MNEWWMKSAHSTQSLNCRGLHISVNDWLHVDKQEEGCKGYKEEEEEQIYNLSHYQAVDMHNTTNKLLSTVISFTKFLLIQRLT